VKTQRGEVRALLLMFVASVLWPMLEHSGALLMRHHAFQIVFLRYAAHLVLLLAIVLPVAGPSKLRTKRAGLQLLRGLCMFCMPLWFVLGRDAGDVRWVWSIFWTMPLLSVIAASLLLRERLYRGAAIAALAGAAGAIAIIGGEAGSRATVFGIAMGGSAAGYMVLSRLLRDESLPASLFYTAIGAGVPTGLIVWRVWTPVIASEVLAILMIGALSLLILGAIDLSLESGPVSLTVPILALIPAWELAITFSANHTQPGLRQLVGTVAIAVGSACCCLAAWPERAQRNFFEFGGQVS